MVVGNSDGKAFWLSSGVVERGTRSTRLLVATHLSRFSLTTRRDKYMSHVYYLGKSATYSNYWSMNMKMNWFGTNSLTSSPNNTILFFDSNPPSNTQLMESNTLLISLGSMWGLGIIFGNERDACFCNHLPVEKPDMTLPIANPRFKSSW